MNGSTTAFVFPGQGAQTVGMGKSVVDAYPAAQAIIEEADDILGEKLSHLMFEGPDEVLADTYNTQPALYVCSMAILKALQTEMPAAVPAFAAGHSLGEFTALAAVGAVSFADGLRLVRERGRLMRDAGETSPGGMAAFIGLDVDAVQTICDETSNSTGKVLVLANDNCPGQVVISGGSDAVDAALEAGKAAGAKRAVRLNLSIASHSPLMRPAADKFSTVLREVTFQVPNAAVYGNVTAAPLNSVEEIISELELQMVKPVRWTESVQAMINDGVESFVEVGSGEVLLGLIKRIDRSKTRIAVNDAESLVQYLQNVGA